MGEAIFIGDIVEKNGKTVKENNMEIKHNIPLKSLVEIKTWDEQSEEEYSGLRLFVVEHDRDFDGTPLYGLSWDINLINKTDEKINETDHPLKKFIKLVNKHKVLRGFSEDTLQIIKNTRSKNG